MLLCSIKCLKNKIITQEPKKMSYTRSIRLAKAVNQILYQQKFNSHIDIMDLFYDNN